jgi:hypothetical protein
VVSYLPHLRAGQGALNCTPLTSPRFSPSLPVLYENKSSTRRAWFIGEARTEPCNPVHRDEIFLPALCSLQS